MAAAGNRAITNPVARPTLPPSTPPTRVGDFVLGQDLDLAVRIAFHDGRVIGVDEPEFGVQGTGARHSRPERLQPCA